MPIKIDNQLPARHSLELENIFIMTESRALTQDIRPLKILILNLMPTKIETETQLLRLLSNSPTNQKTPQQNICSNFIRPLATCGRKNSTA